MTRRHCPFQLTHPTRARTCTATPRGQVKPAAACGAPKCLTWLSAGLDGTDIWPMLMNASQYNNTAAHRTLWLSHEVLLVDNHKIVVSERRQTGQAHYSWENGWEDPHGNWTQPKGKLLKCGQCSSTAAKGCYSNEESYQFRPCLFDLAADPREEHDLSHSAPDVLQSVWEQLNKTNLGAFTARSPEDKLGPCNPQCAEKHWKKVGSKKPTHAPICGVPGCSESAVLPPPGPSPRPSAGPFKSTVDWEVLADRCGSNV